MFGGLSFVWIYIWKYEAPVPFNGYLLLLNAEFTIFITIWCKIPAEWHQDQKFRKRLKYFLVGSVYCGLHAVMYAVMTGVLQSVPRDYQWIPALFSPLIREFNIWITVKIMAGSANGDIDSTKMFFIMDYGISHANFLSLTVGSIATLASSVVIIGVEFILNL